MLIELSVLFVERSTTIKHCFIVSGSGELILCYNKE